MRRLFSLFGAVAALAAQVFGQATVGPNVDTRWHRGVQAGPFGSVNTASGSMETSVSIFDLAGQGGTSIGVSLDHRMNTYSAGTSFFGEKAGQAGRGWDKSLARDLKLQIAKDVALMKSDDRVKGVVWHFWTSSATGKGGPSKPLLNELRKNGIGVKIH